MEVLPSNPRLAIIGAGAVGGYYGSRLAQAGLDVHFLLRSDLETVRAQGLHIRSIKGDFHLPAPHIHATTAEIGPCDVVIIALKSTANAALPDLIRPLLHADTKLLTLQNGLGNEEFLADHFGSERVIGGLCYVCINRTAPGVIDHSAQGLVVIGDPQGPPQPATRALAIAARQRRRRLPSFGLPAPLPMAQTHLEHRLQRPCHCRWWSGYIHHHE